MANRGFSDLQMHGQGIVGVPIRLDGAGAGVAPVASYGPTVQSVTRTAAGRLSIVLTDPFIDCVGCDSTPADTNHATTPTRKIVSLARRNPTNVATTIPARTVEVVIEDISNTGTVTQADLATTQTIFLVLWMKNSAAKP